MLLHETTFTPPPPSGARSRLPTVTNTTQMNLKYHLFEVQTEIVERLALETGAGVFRLVAEHKVRVMKWLLHEPQGGCFGVFRGSC